MLFLNFFVFKQKTAYEMRISDWSSDVCSSDLCGDCPDQAAGSSTAAPGALVFTEAMPLSRPDSSAYIWLLPTVGPLVAVRLKKNLPLLAVLRSKRASSWLFLRTDSMPLMHEPLAEYPSLLRIT